MRTTSSSFRRGTSTVMGTLIFVGIIFTAFIPMLFVMRQADTLHEIRKHELGILDQERAREEINFYAYPDPAYPDNINLRIKNEGSVPIKIVNVWINDKEYPQEVKTQNVNIKSMETIDLDNLPVVLQDLTSYIVKVVTEKGNSFTSLSGTLYYSSSADGWYTPSLGICVHIANNNGKYQIVAEKDSVEFFRYEFKNVEHVDLEVMIWVEVPGSYDLTIKKWDGGAAGDWGLDVVPAYNPSVVEVEYPATKPITDVYVSGIIA